MTQTWGADQSMLLYIYKALIRSRIDYGCIVYDTGARAVPEQVDTIANEVLRIASGAFKGSPVISVQALTGEYALDRRRIY